MDLSDTESVHLAIAFFQRHIFAFRETMLIASEDDLIILGPVGKDQFPTAALVSQLSIVFAAVPEPFKKHAAADSRPFLMIEMTVGGQWQQKFIPSPWATLGKIVAARQFKANVTDHRNLTI
jgi:hypothetical protein